MGNAPVQPGANFAKEELIVHVLCLQGHVEDLGALLEVEAVQWYQLHLSVMPAFTSGKDCHLHVVTILMLPFYAEGPYNDAAEILFQEKHVIAAFHPPSISWQGPDSHEQPAGIAQGDNECLLEIFNPINTMLAAPIMSPELPQSSSLWQPLHSH